MASRMNPFYLRGDFDGDKQPDYAVFVQHRETNKDGIIICHRGKGEVTVIGAGTSFSFEGGHRSDDFHSFDFWEVYDCHAVRELTGMRGCFEGILIGKAEAGSGLIYRKGRIYLWLQLGI